MTTSSLLFPSFLVLFAGGERCVGEVFTDAGSFRLLLSPSGVGVIEESIEKSRKNRGIVSVFR
jgi:hypothetical protein